MSGRLTRAATTSKAQETLYQAKDANELLKLGKDFGNANPNCNPTYTRAASGCRLFYHKTSQSSVRTPQNYRI